jgi:hypothetical protein
VALESRRECREPIRRNYRFERVNIVFVSETVKSEDADGDLS